MFLVESPPIHLLLSFLKLNACTFNFKKSSNYFITEDVLVEDKGECVICFEELEKGDTIARLPCLCVYHKGYDVYIYNSIFG